MELINREDVSCFTQAEDGYNIICLTRTGGHSSPPYDSLNLSNVSGDDEQSVKKNYDKLFSTFGVDKEKFVQLNQVHGDKVLVLKRGENALPAAGDFDAVVSDDTDLILSIMTADCVPVFLYDTGHDVFAAVHAGWRGTAKCIAAKAADVMASKFSCDRANIRAVIGPSIGSCCYEVDAEALNALTDSLLDGAVGVHSVLVGKAFVDLKKYNVAQLIGCGLNSDNITVSDQCTFCNTDLFFSYRRENETGRQLSFIQKK